METSVPPYDIEAEQATLGAMLIERAAVEKALEIVSCGDFYRPEHQTWFDAIRAVSNRDEPTDFVVMKGELNRRGDYERAGGDTYLAALLDAVPSAANVSFYAHQVRQMAVKRRFQEVGQELYELAQHPATLPDALLMRARSLLDEIGGRIDEGQTSEIVDMAYAWAKPVEEEAPIFGDILFPGSQTVISSPGGLGKTTVVYNLVAHLAEGRELWGIPIIRPYQVRVVDMETSPRLRHEKLRRLYGDESPVSGMADFVSEVKDFGRFLRQCKQDGVELVVFDTASRCFPRADENSNGEFYAKIVPVLDAFKRENIATLTVAHTGKGATGVRGASAFTDALDIALSLELHEGKAEDPDAVLVLKCLKNRLRGFAPPVYLQRDGLDRFRRVEGTTKPDDAESTPTARVRCAGDVLHFLESSGQPEKFTAIVKAMVVLGHAEGTAKKIISALQKQGQISHNGSTGYVIEAGSDD